MRLLIQSLVVIDDHEESLSTILMTWAIFLLIDEVIVIHGRVWHYLRGHFNDWNQLLNRLFVFLLLVIMLNEDSLVLRCNPSAHLLALRLANIEVRQFEPNFIF